MTSTIICIIVTALAIEADKITQYRYRGFPLVVLGGVLAIAFSLVL